jgi:hypothetical protein
MNCNLVGSIYRGEDLKKSANQKQELPMVAMFVNGSGQNEQSLEKIFHRCFLPSFTSFGTITKNRNFPTFLPHLAKGNVSFCHHLASVVRRLSSVNFTF